LIGRTYAVFTYRKAIIFIPGALGVAAVVLGFVRALPRYCNVSIIYDIQYEVFQTFCVSGLAQFGGSSRCVIYVLLHRSGF
jgi:hypothetical protein